MAKITRKKKVKAKAVIKKRKARISKKIVARGIKKEAFGVQEVDIEKTKFFPSEAPKSSPSSLRDLPSRYGQDKIVLAVRDPWWIYAYWELTPETIERVKNELKDAFHQARYMLRVYDVSHIIFNGNNAHRYFDIEINAHANNWYIDTKGPGRSWCVDLGLLLRDGRFITILRSNIVTTPLEGPSWITDEEWMIPDDQFARLYGRGGLGGSSLMRKRWLASMSSPVKKAPLKKKT